jgi:phosphatidylethanolamine/phosphatidyl-N-methylethanolamine N-methyltransferase
MLADWQVFFAQWLRHPLAIGAALPTNPLVGRTAARWLSVERPGFIVELGGGIGSVSLGLLRAGCPAERLVILEREPAFVDVLKRRFPGVRILCGDAGDLVAVLRRHGIDRVASVLSCLPIKWFSPALQRSVVEQSFAVLDPKGCMLQLTNVSASPLPMDELHLSGQPVARVWFNFLPMVIWRYTRPAVERAPAAA